MAKQSRRRRTPQGAAPPPPLNAIPPTPRGSLLVIGGNENKDGQPDLLQEIADRAAGGTLVVATMASEQPQAVWQEYRKVFRKLGVKKIVQLDVRTREELVAQPRTELVDDAKVVFFAGGDQLKITSRFGGTALCERLREIYGAGAMIAGTSSGASVMSETMMVAGAGDESHVGTESIRMAPGLGFVPGIILDQHFAERGRMGRLLAAVAQNPRMLGLGIDEDTGVLFDGHQRLTVLGSGAVYVVDGRAMTFTSATAEDGRVASIYGMVVHVLNGTDAFDLVAREPARRSSEEPARRNTQRA